MRLTEKFKLLEESKQAILAINFYNFETLKGVLFAAQQCKMPIILQLTESSLNYMGLQNAFSMARTGLDYYEVQGWIHLDHGSNTEIAKKCIDIGFDSVMYDGSELTLEKNIENTKVVVQHARDRGVNVEAELGYVAKLGQSETKVSYTKPEDAKRFVEETGVDALAVAIGTAHGFYKKKPNLQFGILEQIHQCTDAYLVLHGGSGIQKTDLLKSIHLGIRKINLATEVKNIFMSTLKTTLKDNLEIDLRKVFPVAIKAVSDLVNEKLNIISNESKQK